MSLHIVHVKKCTYFMSLHIVHVPNFIIPCHYTSFTFQISSFHVTKHRSRSKFYIYMSLHIVHVPIFSIQCHYTSFTFHIWFHLNRHCPRYKFYVSVFLVDVNWSKWLIHYSASVRHTAYLFIALWISLNISRFMSLNVPFFVSHHWCILFLWNLFNVCLVCLQCRAKYCS